VAAASAAAVVAAAVVSAAAAVVAVAAVAVTDQRGLLIPSGEASGLPGLAFFISKMDKHSSSEGHVEVEGYVRTVLRGTMFRVELDNKHMVLATVCGKMRKRFVRLNAGDRVRMEMSPYDLDRARITWRIG
jgi:translation initiation factor IF-1